ncbi:hypothetical protein Pmani_007911 [Petrolisthes manimaculis]|uniref:Uncharacterized protein n=1 Tax=Petrolisthes manimaculis TaxID=1843537 RepID=A0AAE1UK91_9EUCA|nr:hypothetical protein Pmani_007911 [Petrolisthes manimaculis]
MAIRLPNHHHLLDTPTTRLVRRFIVIMCDNSADCEDKSDEKDCTHLKSQGNCPGSAFECRYGSQCIDNDFICDGHDNCIDGSDEEDCQQQQVTQTPMELEYSSSMQTPQANSTLHLLNSGHILLSLFCLLQHKVRDTDCHCKFVRV